jgi:hypothetical protein
MVEQERSEIKEGTEESDPRKAPIPALGPADAPHGAPTDKKVGNQTERLEQEIDRKESGMLYATAVMAVFTVILAALTGLQAYSFIESERALIILKDVRFTYGDLIDIDSNRDLAITLRNVGKHVPRVAKIEIDPVYGVVKKSLPAILADHADARGRNAIRAVIPPLPPDTDYTLFPIIRRTKPAADDQTFMAGLLDGSIPMWVYGEIEYDIGYPQLPRWEGWVLRPVCTSKNKTTNSQSADVPDL